MLTWVIVFLIIALISGLLGFTKISGEAIRFARILFVIFLILFLISLAAHAFHFT